MRDSSLLVLANTCIQKKISIVTAESCTGGLLAGRFTDVAGSSQWFEGGWVTYSNQMKHKCLGVKDFSMGAVSAGVVQEMAVGALDAADQANFSISVSGIAGPGGATFDKPVGTVWISWCLRSLLSFDAQNIETRLQQAHTELQFQESLSIDQGEDFILCLRFQYDGDRAAIQSQAVDSCLKVAELLLDISDSNAPC